MKRTPLKKISDKHKLELERRTAVRIELELWSDGTCMTCKSLPDWRGLSLSHIIPLSQGGKTDTKNCILECYKCHSKRHGIKEL